MLVNALLLRPEHRFDDFRGPIAVPFLGWFQQLVRDLRRQLEESQAQSLAQVSLCISLSFFFTFYLSLSLSLSPSFSLCLTLVLSVSVLSRSLVHMFGSEYGWGWGCVAACGKRSTKQWQC